MSDIIDLDALVPASVIIKIGGAEVTVSPPKTGDFLRLGYLGQRLEKAESLGTDELDQLIQQLTDQIIKCIPEIAGQALSSAQLLKLVEIISQMAMPPDSKELKDRGVEVDNPKKAQ